MAGEVRVTREDLREDLRGAHHHNTSNMAAHHHNPSNMVEREMGAREGEEEKEARVEAIREEERVAWEVTNFQVLATTAGNGATRSNTARHWTMKWRNIGKDSIMPKVRRQECQRKEVVKVKAIKAAWIGTSLRIGGWGLPSI